MAAESPPRGLRRPTAEDQTSDQGSAPEQTLTGGPDPLHDLRNWIAVVLANLDYALGEVDVGRTSGLGDALRDAREAAGHIASSLPAKPLPAGARSGTDPHLRRLAPQQRPARVLVVDDDPAMARAVRRSLGGHDVVVASDGRQALEMIAGGERFDVVLCDMMMPDTTGADLHARVQRIDCDQAARFVFVTGGATTTRTREFLESVGNRVVDKPFDPDKLRAIVRDVPRR